MKPTLTYILLTLLLISCRQEGNRKNTSESQDLPADSSNYLSVEPTIFNNETTEYLEPALTKINGKLPVVCTTKELYALLGRPDSIVAPDLENICVSYFNKAFKYAYYGKSYFEISGDSAAVAIIHFDKIEVVYNQKITLNNSTTIASLLKKISYRDKQDLDIANIDKTSALKIAISKESSDYWLLFFVDGKLKKMDYWMPC